MQKEIWENSIRAVCIKKDSCVVIQFNRELLCNADVLGKTFTIKNNGDLMAFEFPEAISKWDFVGFDELTKPPHSPEFNVEWGHVYSRPNIKAGVKTIVCYMKGSVTVNTFNRFQKFRERFQIIADIYSQELIPDPQPIILQQTSNGKGEVYTGINVFIRDGKKLIEIRNPNNTHVINVNTAEDDSYNNVRIVEETITMALSDKPISRTYMLLIAAYRAFERSDFRSAVIIGGTSLEMSMLTKIKKIAGEQGIEIHFPIGEMGRKLDKLKELKTDIPVEKFKEDLINFRNDVIHKGIDVSDRDAREYLKKVRTSLFSFEPDIVIKSE